MNRTEFLSLSVAIHALLLAAIFLMPAPFPSPKLPKYSEELLYVQPVTLGALPDERHHAGKTGADSSPGGPSATKAEKGAGLKMGITSRKRGSVRIWSNGPDNPRLAAAGASPAQDTVSLAGAVSETHTTQPSKRLAVQPAAVPLTPHAPLSAPPSVSSSSSATSSPPEIKAVAERRVPAAIGVKAERETVNFKYQKGWPAPGMVKVRVNVLGAEGGGTVSWKAKADEDWLIISPVSGAAPGVIRIGVDPAKVSVGFYDATVSIVPSDSGVKGDEVDVTLMVLPKEKGTPYLPHYAYDGYMNGECKVCHMPEELLPEPDFMLKPEFCSLCHNPSGMAKAFVLPHGGHPLGVKAGAGGTRVPTRGTDPKGPWSDKMGTHIPGGKIVCITCHDVMEKPGDYGRSWEPASSDDGVNWWLYKGGWDGMGYITPKVYLAESVAKMPKKVREMRRMEVPPTQYSYDEREGIIIFKKPVPNSYSVYVTLTNPYLRITTEHNALCYDCHSENTHEGLNCLVCHRIHGGGNKKAVRDMVRTANGVKKVYFSGREGAGSFADGSGSGICEVCHALSGSHLKYRSKDCTRCHNHMNGFI
jgi:hypothetical protein